MTEDTIPKLSVFPQRPPSFVSVVSTSVPIRHRRDLKETSSLKSTFRQTPPSRRVSTLRNVDTNVSSVCLGWIFFSSTTPRVLPDRRVLWIPTTVTLIHDVEVRSRSLGYPNLSIRQVFRSVLYPKLFVRPFSGFISVSTSTQISI